MKRFLIHVSTYWCGMDNTFRAEAESELELDEIADQLAYDNFQSYGCEADIAEEEGYDPDEMEDSDWDKLWETVDESQYYNFTIEEFEGMEDLKNRILRTPLDPVVTFDDDPLRIIRGVRFAVTKGFDFSDEVHSAIENYDYYTKMKVVSEDRIREELLKCFKYDTHATLMWLFLVGLDEYIFNETSIWLKPTNGK